VGASSVNGLRSLLPAIAAVELRDGTLTLLGKANETIAILEPIPPAGIENRWWTVVAYRWGLRLHKLYSRFGAVAFSNGSVLGSLGCYQLMGTYVLAGDQIDVRSGASVNCLGNSWQLPDEVFPHLKGPHRIVLEEDRMTLIDAKGRPDIVLSAVPY
jgi:hypothetical protein